MATEVFKKRTRDEIIAAFRESIRKKHEWQEKAEESIRKIREERLLKVLRAPHVSEKASTAMEKSNTIVLKVAKDATKAEIKAAVQKLFEVEVEVVNTLVVKGKVKRHGQRIGRRSDWKKAYVTLKEGQNLDFVGGAE